jgi:DNA-binding transcriptional regulator YdaS (Cro superfamily)
MTPEEAVSTAAKMIGSQACLARRLKVSPPTVNQWCSGDRPIPAARAIQIESLTGGVVTRNSLCPSFPWSELAA